MKGNTIVVNGPDVRGKFEECTVSGTPKPGTCMQVTSAAPAGGRFTYAAFSRGDGFRAEVCVLREDELQGRLATEAYVSGERGFLYWPVPGDELNMLLKYQPGTGTNLNENIGDLLEIDGATGKLQGVGTGGPTGSHLHAPFVLMEHLGVALSADVLVFVKYRGG